MWLSTSRGLNVFDLSFGREVRPRLRGRASLVRRADDFVIGFERQDDAKRVMAVLGERFGRFGLTRHPDETRLALLFGGQGPATGQEVREPGSPIVVGSRMR